LLLTNERIKYLLSAMPALDRARRGLLTFIVGGEPFELPWPFLAMHSPKWAKKMTEDRNIKEVKLDGDPDSFRFFLNFLQGTEGKPGEIHPDNLLHVLRWGEELGVDYVRGACEAFLLDPSGLKTVELSPEEVLEIAARFHMPKLYEKAVEITGHGMKYIEVPEGSHSTFGAEELRSDVLKVHLSMGTMSHDGIMRNRHRFADQSSLPDKSERSRLLWKSRTRFRQPPSELCRVDWKSLQTVWPHHSLRDEDWAVVPAESQPTMPTRAVAGAGADSNKRYK